RSFLDVNLDASDRRILANIARVGWHVLLIPDAYPNWGFSVGLYKNLQHPEVVVFGLELEVAGRFITTIAGQISAGATFEAGRQYPGILKDAVCEFRPVC